MKKWKEILLITNTVLLLTMLGYVGYHYSSINLLTENIKKSEEQRERANRPVAVDMSNDALAANSAILGNPSAKVTIVKFNSFSCGFCRQASKVVEEIHKKYPNEVRIVYKHFNRSGQDVLTGQAVQCAGDQGKFWPMYHGLFDNRVEEEEDIYRIGAKLGLNAQALKNCVSSKKYENKTNEDTQLGQNIGANGTPAYIIQGQLFAGHRPISFFDEKIKAALQ